MSALFVSLIKDATLKAAFAKVEGNGGSAGGDGQSVVSFAGSLDRNCLALAAALRDGSYRPLPLRAVDIPKKRGGIRRLMIPSVRDRVVQTAVASLLDPILDPLFSPDSFAYRQGRSVDMAVRRVNLYYRQGFPFVAETDIRRCFDEIPHDSLLAQVEQVLGSNNADMIDLIALWLEQFGTELQSPGRGLAQGSPLAPLLANLYLDQLDDALDDLGIRFVRFADDFVMLARSESAAHNALGDAAGILRRHGLEIAGDKTRVTAFDKGFEFLGHLFLRSLVLRQVNDPEENPLETLGAREQPAAAETASPEAPDDFRVLYVMEPGRHLTLRNLSFSVTHDEKEVIAVHHRNIDRIELGSGVSTDMPALRLALQEGIDLHLVDGHGHSAGRLESPLPDRAALHLAQAQLVLDSALCVVMARTLVEAKLRNQRAQLSRLNRLPRDAEVMVAIRDIGRIIRKLPGATEVNPLRGMEGAAAATYWPALGRLCSAVSGVFRRERPAESPLNAAINYLTAMLARDIRSAILRVGLHPGFGTLHAPRDRYEPLVYDLMEIFRAPLTEGLAVGLFNQGRLKLEMFHNGRMDRDAVRAVIMGYEAALDRRITRDGRRLPWRKVMEAEARAFARHCGDPQKHRFEPIVLDY